MKHKVYDKRLNKGCAYLVGDAECWKLIEAISAFVAGWRHDVRFTVAVACILITGDVTTDSARRVTQTCYNIKLHISSIGLTLNCICRCPSFFFFVMLL